jgi:hypothetical protein
MTRMADRTRAGWVLLRPSGLRREGFVDWREVDWPALGAGDGGGGGDFGGGGETLALNSLITHQCYVHKALDPLISIYSTKLCPVGAIASMRRE